MTTRWKDVAIGEVAEIQSGNSISKSRKESHFVDVQDGTPYVATKDISFDSIVDYDNGVSIPHEEIDNFRIAKKGDVLICAEGGSAGRKIGLLDRDVCFVNKLFRVHLESQGKWLFYVFQGRRFQDQFKENLAGLIGGVSKSKFKSIRIPIPPLDEQERIVEVLDEAFTAIDKAKVNLERNLTNAREIKDSIIERLFLKKEWNFVQLGSIASFKNGVNYSKSSEGEEIKVIGVGDFKNRFWLNQEAVSLQTMDAVLSPDYLAQKGDLFFVRSNGNPNLIGRVVLLGEEIKSRMTHSGFTIRMRLTDPHVTPEILGHFLKSRIARAKLVEGGSGTGIRSLNQKTLGTLLVPISNDPSFCEFHKAQLRQLDHCNSELIGKYQSELDNLEELRQSILEQAFEGKLTEPVAP